LTSARSAPNEKKGEGGRGPTAATFPLPLLHAREGKGRGKKRGKGEVSACSARWAVHYLPPLPEKKKKKKEGEKGETARRRPHDLSEKKKGEGKGGGESPFRCPSSTA